MLRAEVGAQVRIAFPDARGIAVTDAFEERRMWAMRSLLPMAALTTCARLPAPAGPMSGRAEIRLVK